MSENWVEEIKDPNVSFKLLGPPQVFKPYLPIKRWVDMRALSPNNFDEDFLYKTYLPSANGPLTKRFLLSREAAAGANVPGDSDKPQLGEIPLPCRDLLPDETLNFDPFGRIFVLKKTEGTQEQKLDQILQKLDSLLARNG